MEKFFNQLGIGTRIAILTIIPLIVAIIFAFNTANTARISANNAEKVENIAGFAPHVSELVHELQKERGRSAGFIGSGLDRQLQLAVNTQRKDTDTKLSTFATAEKTFDQSTLPPEFTNIINRALQSLYDLQKSRRVIDAGEYSVPQMAQYYTSTINNLLHIIKFMAVSTGDPEIIKALTGHIGLLEAKERAGLERAMGNVGFNSGSFPTPIYNRFVNLLGQQQAFISIFKNYASSDLVQYYDSTVKGDAVLDVENMRNFALNTKGALDNGQSIPTNWFEKITVKIDRMKLVEDLSNRRIKELANSHYVASSSTFWFMSTLFSVGSAVVLLLTYIVFKSVSSPLSRIKASMEDLAGGNLETHVPCVEYSSEIGAMAHSVDRFKANAIERFELEVETKRAEISHIWKGEEDREQASISAAEAKARAKAAEEAEQLRLQKAMEELAQRFEKEVGSVIEELTLAARNLETTSGSMIEQARENEARGGDVASASRQTSQNVQTVASATEELSSSVSEISRQVAESKNISHEALNRSVSTSETVEELSRSSKKIEDVLGLITDIAEQTNLLALNATIEAARAGEAGKGFAVVAQEVKALADQTSKATEEISAQIGAMQSVSKDVSSAVEMIRDIIQKTNDISSDISISVEQQNAATAEISRSMQEASVGADQVLSSVDSVQLVAQKTKESSSEVRSSSETLTQHCHGLQNAVKSFLAELAANGRSTSKI